MSLYIVIDDSRPVLARYLLSLFIRLSGFDWLTSRGAGLSSKDAHNNLSNYRWPSSHEELISWAMRKIPGLLSVTPATLHWPERMLTENG